MEIINSLQISKNKIKLLVTFKWRLATITIRQPPIKSRQSCGPGESRTPCLVIANDAFKPGKLRAPFQYLSKSATKNRLTKAGLPNNSFRLIYVSVSGPCPQTPLPDWFEIKFVLLIK